MEKRDPDTLFDIQFLDRLERLRLLAKSLAGRTAGGARRGRRMGDGLEFADHRDYAAGDDVRFIDWPYYARMEKLLVRLFHEHSEGEVAFLLDASGSMAPGGDDRKFRAALRTTGALAYIAMGSQDRVTILPFAERFAPARRLGRNRAQILEMLRPLGELSPSGKTDLAACAAHFAAGAESGAIVVILSDLQGCEEQLDEALRDLLTRRCDVTVAHVYTPEEAAPELHGPVELTEAETGRQLTTTVTPDLIEVYRKRWSQRQAELERICTGCGARYVAAPTDAGLETQVLETLRQAGLVEG